MNLTCLYSCSGCGAKDRPVVVPARGDAEDVGDWMDSTRKLVSLDHAWHSPTCRARVMQELKIPMTGAQRVGGPSVN